MLNYWYSMQLYGSYENIPRAAQMMRIYIEGATCKGLMLRGATFSVLIYIQGLFQGFIFSWWDEIGWGNRDKDLVFTFPVCFL